MTEKKYRNHVVPIPSYVARYFGRQEFIIHQNITGERLGLQVTFAYHYVKNWFQYGRNPHRPHVHDFDEVLLFIGTDPDDITRLGAQADVFCGKEEEKYVITRPGAVACPKGWPHCPLTITRVDGPFIFGLLSFSDKHSATTISLPREPLRSDQEKYKKYVLEFPFKQEHQGGQEAPPLRVDGLRHLNLSIQYRIFKEPASFGKESDNIHAHEFDEVMLFLSNNSDDETELMGEAEIALGKEREKHIIRVPTAVKIPKGMPHQLLSVSRIDKPFMLMTLSYGDKNTVIKLP